MVEKAHGILKAQRKEPVVVEVVESSYSVLKVKNFGLELKGQLHP